MAVKTPPRPSSPTAATEPRHELPAPFGHAEEPLLTRGRILWSVAMLVLLTLVLVVGYLLRPGPTWEGDWKDLIQPTTGEYTGDWKDLVQPTTGEYTGDWKDLVQPTTGEYTGDWKDLVQPTTGQSSGDWKDLLT